MLVFYLSVLDTPEERSKFEELYIKYGKLMKYVAYNILCDDALAEDAVHNAFLKLMKYLNKIDEVNCHKTKSFIVIVTESVSKDMYMKRKREATVNIDDNEQEIYVDSPDLDSNRYTYYCAGNRETSRYLQRCTYFKVCTPIQGCRDRRSSWYKCRYCKKKITEGKGEIDVNTWGRRRF